MRVLGIESSCDETGVALYDSNKGLIGHLLHSQISLHKPYGGVVPELASRDHIRKIIPLINTLITNTHTKLNQINGVAYTQGPGLVGALLVGAATGCSIAWSLGIPAIGIHHMEGHLLAIMLEENQPQFPFIALLVSGGHTQLVEVKGIGNYSLLGNSIDDAAGEAFDKTARLLGLNYPGGPALEELSKQGNPNRFYFPRPMINKSGLDFSFSGLKTFAFNIFKNARKKDRTLKCDIARAFEDAVIETLINKCSRALKEKNINTLVIAGGVSANKRLRKQVMLKLPKLKGKIFFPRPEFCTDNGAMIAYAGWQRLKYKRENSNDNSFQVKPRWSLKQL